MSASLLDLSDRSELDDLAPLLADIHMAARRIGLMLVGATARDLVLHHVHKIPRARATIDVDFAVSVSTWDDFAAFREALVSSGRFEQQIAQHTLRHSEGDRWICRQD